MKTLVLAAGIVCAAVLQSPAMRVDAAVALKQVIKKVAPVLPPDVVAANPGAPFAADVTIRADGTVESVAVIVGPEALRSAAVAALKQWTFKPFTNGGRPVRAIALIDIMLADPVREAAIKAGEEFTAAFFACSRSIETRAADADTVCNRLVRLSERMEPDAYERVKAVEQYALSLFFTNKFAEAVVQLERVLEMRRGRADSSTERVGLYQVLAETHIRLTNLRMADQYYQMALEALEGTTPPAAPLSRDYFNESLNGILKGYAALKRSMGQLSEAQAFDAKAATLTLPVRGAPIPAARRIAGVLCLGPTGPLLTDDDVRQILRRVPAGKNAWLLVGHREDRTSGAILRAEIYLEPDVTTSQMRRGRMITAEAPLAAGASLTAQKTWVDGRLFLDYVQVLLDGRDPNDIRGSDDRNRPIIVSKSMGEGLTDVEVVDIATVVRAAADKVSASSGPVDRAQVYRDVQRWPMEHMTRWSNGEVDVTLKENKTLDGGGQLVKLRRVGSSWVIVEVRPG